MSVVQTRFTSPRRLSFQEDKPTMTVHDFDSLDGLTVLITGGAGHIGSTLTTAFLDKGSRVATADLAAAPAIGVFGEADRHRHFVVDLSDPVVAAKLVDQVVDEFGRLDVVVVAASWMGTSTTPGWNVPFEDQDVALWPEVLSVGVTANFSLVRRARTALAANGCGSVILISSLYGFCAPHPAMYVGTGVNNIAGYAASKGALTQLARWLSTMMAPEVRVNALSPGGIFRDQEPDFVRRYEERTPLGRMASEDDLVGPVLFLASDLSRYVTGHDLVVDGGYSVW